jgi:alpha-L-rhamnosidase
VPDERLKFAKGYYDSPRGRIVSEWRYIENSNTFAYHFEIPGGMEAELELPSGEKRILTSGSYEI